jgi:TfoX/Sxy family transcriptional regulator of competence genes
MAHDEKLAARLRALLEGNGAVAEKKMFGGLAFLVNGNMSVGVHKDWLIARLSAEAAAEALQRPGAKVMDITGRPMKGWLMIAPDGVASDESLRAWVEESVAFAGSLPSKGS